ncbi:MAG: ABC transporter ATP-binding protein [Parvibaculaceae bacterium]
MSKEGLPLRFEGIAKRYQSVVALQPTDLAVEAGEFLTLLGPSGSGKTTLLNLTAGYIDPSGGRVFLGGRDITELPARSRNIGMVFQSYALFPHMSVGENVAYGLKVRRKPPAEIADKVAAALSLVDLEGYGARGVHELSGGQQQRVALARALVIEPDVLLMDEPLGALDRQLRRNVQLELRRLHEEHRRTTLYVTHDQEEALILSDRIAIMRGGRIEQIGKAKELYSDPANAFVASFMGESNLLAATVRASEDGAATLDVPALGRMVRCKARSHLQPGQATRLLVRPEHVTVRPDGEARATVKEVVYLGELVSVRLLLRNGEEMWSRQMGEAAVARGQEVGFECREELMRALAET